MQEMNIEKIFSGQTGHDAKKDHEMYIRWLEVKVTEKHKLLKLIEKNIENLKSTLKGN